MRKLSLDAPVVDQLLSATEAAAIAASEFVGSGDKVAVDAAAVRAMRVAFDQIAVNAVVVVGEGEKDRAPMLFAAERLGTGKGPALDIAVDPVDGTRLAAEGLSGSVAVLSVAASGAFFDPGPMFYLEKLVTSGAGRGLGLDRPLGDILRELADALGKPISELQVAVQTRPRNQRYLDAVRQAGAVVLPFQDGDVDPALRAARADGDIDDLVSSDGYLFLTAVTSGDTLAGVIRDDGGVITDSWIVDPHRGVLRVTRRHPLL